MRNLEIKNHFKLQMFEKFEDLSFNLTKNCIYK